MNVVNLINNPELSVPPFTFNPLKHHLGFIRDIIEITEQEVYKPVVFKLINSIGSQLTDIYYGDYSVDHLSALIREQLISSSLFDLEAYENWVDNSDRKYNFLVLPDGSKWIFRRGEKEGRYIHFHPARLSKSFSIRGTTLRTAITLKILARDNSALYGNADFINSVRQNHLMLSPVKNIQSLTAIRKVLDLLR